MNLRFILHIIFLFCSFSLFPQKTGFPVETDFYPFIDYSTNSIDIYGDSATYKTFFKKLDTLIQSGTGKIGIVHMGGSHIQADMYTQQIRRDFENFQPGITGDRGFVFPYKIAQTNNPVNYRVSYTGVWTACKNVDKNDSCILGLSGISVTTANPSSTIKISINNDPVVHYYFNKLKIYHPGDKYEFRVNLNPDVKIKSVLRLESMGYTEFLLQGYTDSVDLFFEKSDTLQNKFELQGLSFESDSIQGITYHTIGVNGAKISSFLSCRYLPQQLQSLRPDMVILSFGTNDGYTTRFSKTVFKEEYTRLIETVQSASPGAAILITVPNDSYLFRRYVNKNTAVMKNIIFDIAAEKGLAVWDFYSVMGGFGSSDLWYNAGLMSSDRIHFNKAGYSLNGDLLFSAFIKAWEVFLNNQRNGRTF